MTETSPYRELFSHHCWTDQHHKCVVKKCQCPCHEERPRGPISYFKKESRMPVDDPGPKGVEGTHLE